MDMSSEDIIHSSRRHIHLSISNLENLLAIRGKDTHSTHDHRFNYVMYQEFYCIPKSQSNFEHVSST